MLRLKLSSNWSIVAIFSIIFFTAKALGADNPESGEIFLPHLRGTDIYPVGFSQEAMVMAYNCKGSTKQEAVFLNPSWCKRNLDSQENFVQRTIVFMPRPDEHKMFVCEASLSIQGNICGFASLQYQNILNNDGAHVIIDVTTNDLQGARALPRAAPEEVTDHVERLVAAVKEKAVVGVIICETKPMSIMNVTPLSDILHRRCQKQKVGWCQTQVKLEHMKEDGYHIRPPFLQIIDNTCACAVMWVRVPHPTLPYKKWKHQLREQEWPRMEERPGTNVWRRREVKRRTQTRVTRLSW
jgi:hypothetical protein